MIGFHLLAIFLLLTPLAIWRMRADYRRLGRLSWSGLTVLLVWFFVPHLALDFAVRYVSPWALRQYLGLAVMLPGAVLAVVSVFAFGSVAKLFGRKPGGLTVSGVYRWSRNPQYVAWFLVLLGFAVMWWTWRCSVALAMLAAALQILALVEEEHLRRVFGNAYEEYRRRVPRWLGWPRHTEA